MKPEAKVDISPKTELKQGKSGQPNNNPQAKNRPTLEVARGSLLQLDELDMIVTTRGTHYFQN